MSECLSVDFAVGLVLLGLIPGIGLAIPFMWLWARAQSKWINAERKNIVMNHSIETMKIMQEAVQAK